MKAVVVTKESLPHQKKWGHFFGKGLERHGWKVIHAGAPQPCDMLVLWGVRHKEWIEAQKRAGGEVCILERGFIRDRHEWASVSFGGGLNGYGEFRGPFDDPSRWEKHFADLMQPWEHVDNGYALLIGQVKGDNSVKHVDLQRWYVRTTKALADRGWEVKFRPHPLTEQRAGREMTETLEQVLRGAGVVITFNSNAGVDAVLYGRPVIALDQGSMAWDVAGHDLDTVIMPDRMAWAHKLAYCQWTTGELKSGEAWEAITNGQSEIHRRGRQVHEREDVRVRA